MFTTCVCESKVGDIAFEFRSKLVVYVTSTVLRYTDLLVHSASHLGKL
jgi:hypothetical protein